MWSDAMNSILQGDFMLGTFQVIMAVSITVVNIILYPFGLLVKTFIPNLDAGLIALSDYFDYATTYMAWILNAFAVPTAVVAMVASYYLFVFSVTFGTWSVKLILKWRQAIWG
jgi:hypothetical protein